MLLALRPTPSLQKVKLETLDSVVEAIGKNLEDHADKAGRCLRERRPGQIIGNVAATFCKGLSREQISNLDTQLNLRYLQAVEDTHEAEDVGPNRIVCDSDAIAAACLYDELARMSSAAPSQ
jgi:hypothetical protein